MIKKIPVILGSLLFCLQCKTSSRVDFAKDVINVTLSESQKPPAYDIDPRLKPHLDRFAQEAALRGIQIQSLPKLRHLKYVQKLSTTTNPNVIAVCKRVFHSKNSIQGVNFVEEHSIWLAVEVSEPSLNRFLDQGSPENREDLTFLVVTHELIHCVLGLLHAKFGLMAPFLGANTDLLVDIKQTLDEALHPDYLGTIPKATH